MILNDMTLQDPLVREWAEEIDRRLTDEVGHLMLVYGEEIAVERRGKVAYLRLQWTKLAADLRELMYPDDDRTEPVDGTDFYLGMAVNTIKHTINES